MYLLFLLIIFFAIGYKFGSTDLDIKKLREDIRVSMVSDREEDDTPDEPKAVILDPDDPVWQAKIAKEEHNNMLKKLNPK